MDDTVKIWLDDNMDVIIWLDDLVKIWLDDNIDVIIWLDDNIYYYWKCHALSQCLFWRALLTTMSIFSLCPLPPNEFNVIIQLDDNIDVII